MTKDNILFSIIGVLLGVIAGYVFATTVNERGYNAARTSAASAGQTAQGSELPENHPPVSASDAADEAVDSSAERAVLEQAQRETDNFDAQMKAALIHYQNHRYQEAIEFLTRANQLRPDNYQTIVALGNTNFDWEKYEIAEKWYSAALVKNPKDINVRTDLGLSFMFRNPPDYDRAIKEFRQSLETDPEHEQTLQNLVVALTKKGNFAEADATLKKLSEVNPGNLSLTKLRTDLETARSSSTAPAASKKK